MSATVDARGLSCPQPVLMAVEKMQEMGAGDLLVMVDTDASKENVSRAAEAKGWQVRDIRSEGEEYHINLERK
ncbi:MAG: sulfurtransferase TusA family protein [Thermodesulfobacteriota bacterium]|nr:sulfurtransferase TusA family protein [Thermodesulfobacteriota bacterium]